LLLDLPLEPFLEVSPDFSRYFLPSFAILSIVGPDHAPSRAVVCYGWFFTRSGRSPIRWRDTCSNTNQDLGPSPFTQLPRSCLLGNGLPVYGVLGNLVSEFFDSSG
jgi:hypothetical protein